MGTALRTLLIEDSVDDTELLIHHLRRSGYEPAWERVETADDLRSALTRQSWDIVLCDYVMPRLSGPDALQVLRTLAPDLPAIAISGQMGEEYAVEMMRAGARDYVRKGNLARLCPAIERELTQTQLHRRGKLAEAALRRTEEWLQVAVDGARLGIWEYDFTTKLLFLSEQFKANLGFRGDELSGRLDEIASRLHPDDRDAVEGSARAAVQIGHYVEQDLRLQHRDGSYRWFHCRARVHGDEAGAPSHILGCQLDITDRK